MKKGFTLLELTIAIALIGFLAATITVKIRDNQKSARDARRKSDLRTMAVALELYFSKSGEYPLTENTNCPQYTNVTANRWCGESNGFGAKGYLAPNAYIPGSFTPEFLVSLPSDPTKGQPNVLGSCSNEQAGYVYSSDGKDYKLMAYCTPERGVEANDSFRDPSSANADKAFSVYTKGAVTWAP